MSGAAATAPGCPPVESAAVVIRKVVKRQASPARQQNENALSCLQSSMKERRSFHSIAANGNIGLSGQAQWLPVAVTTRNHAPKSPTIPSGHATTRVKRVSAPKGPAHLYSCQHFEYPGRRQRKYCDAANCPY